MRPLIRSKNPRTAPTNQDSSLAVIPAAYRLAKMRSPSDAVAFIENELPERFWRELRRHMGSRPAVFLPSVLQECLRYLDATAAEREVMRLFAQPTIIQETFGGARL